MLRMTPLIASFLVGFLLWPVCGERSGAAQEKGGQKKSPTDYGFVKVKERKETYPPEKLEAPPEGFNEKQLIRVVHCKKHIESSTFDTKIYVMPHNDDTFADVIASGGCFVGHCRVTNKYPGGYIYDTCLLLRRHRIEIVIDYDLSAVLYQEQWRFGLHWYSDGLWHVLCGWY